MKSPVWGAGRNRKHRALSGPNHASAANVNMHGKKYVASNCWCCSCIDMREDYKKKLHSQEMNNLED
jgi:hypothetical protein